MLGLLLAASSFVAYSRIVEARLHGERDRVVPRVFARPLTIYTGQGLAPADLIARLNDLGYVQRSRPQRPGEFAVTGPAIVLVARGGSHAGRQVRLTFGERPVVPASGGGAALGYLAQIEAAGQPVHSIVLEAPMLAGLVSGSRQKRRRVPLAAIPLRVQQAVLAIEDRRFYAHIGIDPMSLAAAVVTNLSSDLPYPVGRSTITQQLARMLFLSEEFHAELQSGTRGRTWSSYRRKLREILMAIVLETKASKDDILELYLNDVYLGNRGSFALHGVAEAARIFFGKDIRNLSLPEAALIAGLIQNPSQHSPFTDPEQARARRDLVLSAMADAGFITAKEADSARRTPVHVVARSVDNEAPYFIDHLSGELQQRLPGITQRAGRLDIYTTLDLNLQRAAQHAVLDGIARVEEALARRRRSRRSPVQAALVAVDPRTGEVRAMIGGRFYNQSQFNRATSARRQPGSVFKPFVYLAAFERAASEGWSDLTPATLVRDEPGTWIVDDREWTPRNYDGEYDGLISLRRALALSRNIPAIRIAERIGFDQVAALWARTELGRDLLPAYPSIALGVVELTPMEVAEAYTLFANGGVIAPLRSIVRVERDDESIRPPQPRMRRVAREETAFLVTHMMRSVIDEGTGAAARAAGFTLDAAGKSGTTNDLRDAWFVGFTPELLAVVWVGFDDNTPLGLSGTQAALPIWAEFMSRALAGQPGTPFSPPEGVSFVEIDRDTGLLALPTCPRVVQEAFAAGTEPRLFCDLHRW